MSVHTTLLLKLDVILHTSSKKEGNEVKTKAVPHIQRQSPHYHTTSYGRPVRLA